MKNLYLIGMMGCGKSTCAALLGQNLDRPVLDTDTELQRAAGMTVSEIFAQYGEEHFRDLETELCRDLSHREGLIVACGGSLPLRRENRALLRGSGTVIFLNRDVRRIYAGLDVSDRPLGREGEAAFIERFHRRKPLYEAAAHIVIGDCPAPEDTTAEILRKLEEIV